MTLQQQIRSARMRTLVVMLLFFVLMAVIVAAVYAFFIAVFVYKDLSLKQVPKVLLDSASMSAMLLYIITNAVLFSFLVTSENIPQTMAAWITDSGLGPITFLLVVNSNN